MLMPTKDSEAKPHTTPSKKNIISHWTPEQHRIQNILLLAGCNLAERLEILLTLPGAELWLKMNNHSVDLLRDAIETWFNTGDRWMEAFEKAAMGDSE